MTSMGQPCDAGLVRVASGPSGSELVSLASSVVAPRAWAVDVAVASWVRDVPAPRWRDLLAVVARAYWRALWARAAGRVTAAACLAGLTRRGAREAMRRAGLKRDGVER